MPKSALDCAMNYKRVVVLTGAGISAESGIRTFRDQNGLWEDHRIEEVATPEGYARNPALVQRFYNLRRAQLLDPALKPNAAHQALADFEQQLRVLGGEFLLVTQNVDNLHQRAGSKQLLCMHGQLQQVRCPITAAAQAWQTDLTAADRCQCCQPAQPLRPDIVWFGEMPYGMEQIEQALLQCDLFIAIGTSGQVYPAAGFVQLANSVGAYTVELNMVATRGEFAAGYYGPASKIVPKLLDQLLQA